MIPVKGLRNICEIGGEKWIPARARAPMEKRSRRNENELPEQTAKPGLHSRKVLLSVWQDYREILYRELHLSNETRIRTNMLPN